MAKNLAEKQAERAVDRAAVDRHKRRMLAEVRAHRLRELREQVSMTQTQLADLLEVTQRRVSSIERGQIDRTQVDTLRRYVEALGGELHVDVKLGDETFQIA
jgi:predicted XRE-type DNA-binding protein